MHGVDVFGDNKNRLDVSKIKITTRIKAAIKNKAFLVIVHQHVMKEPDEQ